VLVLVLRAPVPALALVAALVALLAIQELLKLSEAYRIRPFPTGHLLFLSACSFCFLAVNPGHDTPLLSDRGVCGFRPGSQPQSLRVCFWPSACAGFDLSTAFRRR